MSFIFGFCALSYLVWFLSFGILTCCPSRVNGGVGEINPVTQAVSVRAITRKQQGQEFAPFSQTRKRDGTPCTPTRSELDTSAMNVDIDINETQAAIQPAHKKRKNDEVLKELMAAVVQMAVDNVMKRIDPQRQSVAEEVNGSVERAFDEAVKVLTTDLQHRIT